MTRQEILKNSKPILFNAEMVRAILDGRKTMTRRCVKFLNGKNPNWTGYVKDGLMIYNGTNEPCIKPCQYHPGDIMYVRETWCLRFDGEKYFYKADKHTPREEKRLIDYDHVSWKPSIHMPKEAARIFLKVTNVLVERLQEITWQEAAREGCYGGTSDDPDPLFNLPTLRGEFQKLWNSTIKKADLDRYGWDANPWVWVIEFERIEVE